MKGAGGAGEVEDGEEKLQMRRQREERAELEDAVPITSRPQIPEILQHIILIRELLW